MDKLTMAHEYAMQAIDAGYVCETDTLVVEAWKYANAMHDAAEKQRQEDGKKIREEIREMLKSPNTFVEREGQHFEDEPTIPNQHSSSEL